MGGGNQHGKAWLFNKGGVEICLNIEMGKRVDGLSVGTCNSVPNIVLYYSVVCLEMY